LTHFEEVTDTWARTVCSVCHGSNVEWLFDVRNVTADNQYVNVADVQTRHVATLGQGGAVPPRWMLCPPNIPLAIFFYTLIFHHQYH